MSYHRRAIFERLVPRNDLERTGGDWQQLGLPAFVSLLPLSGREYFTAQQVEARVSHRARTHWRSDVHPKDRMRIGERIFNIEAVLNVGEQNRELELMVVELV